MIIQTKLPLLFILVLALLQIQNSIAQQDSIAMKYASTITVEDLTEDLTILSSDALEGRETGKRGQKMAAAYIKTHFEELGLSGPVKEGNPFYQKVPLVTSKPGDIYLKVGNTKLINFEDMYFYGDPIDTDEVSSEVVFVGAGTEQDFESVDVKGKSALIINYNSRQRGNAMKLALKHGAELIFIVRLESDEEFKNFVRRTSGSLSKGSMGLDSKTEKNKSKCILY